jgi:hypothetical protein
LGFEVHAWLGDAGEEEGGILSILAALGMLAVLLRYAARTVSRRLGLHRK